jgi:hypothetical protein
MKNKHNSEDFGNGDYEWYEERSKGKIKRVSSEHRPRREIRNWKKVWTEHTEDYDEHDEFYGRK